MEILAGWYRPSPMPRRPACDLVPTAGSPFPAFYQMGALCSRVGGEVEPGICPSQEPTTPVQGRQVIPKAQWFAASTCDEALGASIREAERLAPLSHLPSEPWCASLMVGRDGCHHAPSIDAAGPRSQTFLDPHSVPCCHLNK